MLGEAESQHAAFSEETLLSLAFSLEGKSGLERVVSRRCSSMQRRSNFEVVVGLCKHLKYFQNRGSLLETETLKRL